MRGIRAYDIFMASRSCIGIDSKKFHEMQQAARGTQRFFVDDAAVCFRETVNAKGGRMALTDTPPIGIPFASFWMEWNWRKGGEPTPEVTTARGAALCFGTPQTLLVHPYVCAIYRGNPIVDAACSAFRVSLGAGGIIEDVHEHEFGDVSSELVGFPGTAVGIVTFSLALLGAKNTGRVEEWVPRALRRHAGEFAATVRDSHYTLTIPGADQLRDAFKAAGDGVSRKRLHIVRGHFADYSEGSGLFGKLHGRYYIPPHVRGNPSAGTVTKDYRVRAV